MFGMLITRHRKFKLSKGMAHSFVLREIINEDADLAPLLAGRGPLGKWITIGNVAQRIPILQPLYPPALFGHIVEHPTVFSSLAELKQLGGHKHHKRGISYSDKQACSIIVHGFRCNKLVSLDELIYGGGNMPKDTPYVLQCDNLALVTTGNSVFFFI